MAQKKSLPYGKKCLGIMLALATACSVSPVLAAPSDVARPPGADAGAIRHSVDQPPVSGPEKNKVEIEVERQEPPAGPKEEGLRIHVKAFRITGQDIYSQEELQELVKDSVDQDLTLDELQAIAQKIAEYFRKAGYLVANAYLPAQDVAEGTLEIIVVPGKYESIDIRNQSRLNSEIVKNWLSVIKPGDYVKKDVLERALLLMSDTSGVSIKATLAPGKASGTTTLIVEITDSGEVTGTFSLNNHGNYYTGQGRGRVSVDVNNISGQGDVLTLDDTYSGGGLNNAAIQYLLPVGKDGARVGLSYSTMHYKLGKEFEVLEFDGDSKVAGIFASYPIIRSRDANLFAQIGYDVRKLTDNGFGIKMSDKRDNVWSVGLHGAGRDERGFNTYDLSIATGDLSFKGGRSIFGEPAEDIDKSTAKTAGRYTKVNLGFSRQQLLTDRLSFLFSVNGQTASKNLDSSQKLYLGGASGVRAYAEGEASGDAGYLVTGELRWNLPTRSIPSLQLAAFIDHGRVTVHKNPWPGSGDNSLSLSGAGLGLIATIHKDYSVRLDYAKKISAETDTAAPDKNGRWWLTGTQYF
jgi:hemolysin activation/secretion protein